MNGWSGRISEVESVSLCPGSSTKIQSYVHLNRLPEIITPTFTFNDMLVDLARGDVVLASKGDIEVTFA